MSVQEELLLGARYLRRQVYKPEEIAEAAQYRQTADDMIKEYSISEENQHE